MTDESESKAHELPWQEVPITCLERVPIDAPYLGFMKHVLAKYGAHLRETNEPPPPTLTGHPRMYEVHFPSGTTRANGLVMMRSMPFILYFPDRSFLHGAELWPLYRREDDTCIHVLYVSQEEARAFLEDNAHS